MLVIAGQKERASVSEIGTSNVPEKPRAKRSPKKTGSVQSGVSSPAQEGHLKNATRKGTVLHWLTLADNALVDAAPGHPFSTPYSIFSSAKEKYFPVPEMMTWSNIEIPSSLPASTSLDVMARSSRDGWQSVEG